MNTKTRLGLLIVCSLVVGVAIRTIWLQSILTHAPSEISFAVFPHHDLIIDRFQGFYDQFSSAQRTSTQLVIILSPNHFHPDRTRPVTTDAWQIAGVERIASDFDREHGVSLHLPFIHATFPNAQVLPLLLTRHITQQQLDAVLETIAARFPTQKKVVIGSVDFSHDQSVTDAQRNDRQTWQYIQQHQSAQLLSLDDTFVDCPACLYMISTMSAEMNTTPTILFEGNAQDVLGQDKDVPTTSYMAIVWRTLQ